MRVGVIDPVESYWLHWGPAEQTWIGIRRQMDERFQSLTDWLVNGGVDFDFLCESLLPSQCRQGGAPLRVGKMAYDAVVVPGCETLRSTTLERLEAFQRAGGRLIFLGDAPRYAEAKPDERGKTPVRAVPAHGIQPGGAAGRAGAGEADRYPRRKRRADGTISFISCGRTATACGCF